MARICTICTHPERAALDQAIAAGQTSNTALSSQFGVTEAAIRRHKRTHLPASLVQAETAREIARANDLLHQVTDLHQRTLMILAKAESQENLKTALSAIAQARANLELLARLLGELQDQTINVAVLTTSPEWLHLRSVIMAALEPYPEARLAVVGSLRDAGP